MVLPEIFPTELDLGGGGLGRVFNEVNWLKLFSRDNSSHQGINWIKEGFDQTGTSGLAVTFDAGVAVLSSHYASVEGDTVTLVDDTDNYVYLALTRDVNGNVDGTTFDVELSLTPPADSVLLAQIKTASGSIVAGQNRDARVQSPHGAHGAFTGDGTTGRQIQLGFAPLLVVCLRGNLFAVKGRGVFGLSVLGAGAGPTVEIQDDQSLVPTLSDYGFVIDSAGGGTLNGLGVGTAFTAIG